MDVFPPLHKLETAFICDYKSNVSQLIKKDITK